MVVRKIFAAPKSAPPPPAFSCYLPVSVSFSHQRLRVSEAYVARPLVRISICLLYQSD